MKKLLLISIVFATLYSGNTIGYTGHLYKECLGCGGAYDVFSLSWYGPWWGTYLILKYSDYNGGYQPYELGVPATWCDAAPEYDMWFKMWSCNGQDCLADSKSVFIPLQSCSCIEH
jgi:hypothetical protein